MEIHFAHDRPVLIGVAHHRLRAVAVCDANAIIEVPCRVWNFGLKKSIAMNFFRLDRMRPVRRSLNASPARTGRGTVRHDVDLAGIRTKRADREIVPHPVRTEDAERIGMRAGEKSVQLVWWNPSDGERFHRFHST